MLRRLVLVVATAVGLLGINDFITPAQAGDISIGVGIGYRQPGYGAGYYYPAPAYNPAPRYPSQSYYPPVVYPGREDCRHYHVYYRACCRDPWQLYGTYDSHLRAHHIERHLERSGFEARIQHH